MNALELDAFATDAAGGFKEDRMNALTLDVFATDVGCAHTTRGTV